MPVKEIQLRVPATCRPRGARECDRSEVTEAVEEYVEGIWRLERECGHASVGSGEVAQYMNVTPASATTMLKRLAAMGFVEHRPYQSVQCTPKGEALAVELLRKHRLIECLLVDVLGMPWHAVHDLACKLEHYVPLDVADRIEVALGRPTECPHGNPVDATRNDGAMRLADAPDGVALRVVRIIDEREPFLRYLDDAGLRPGARVTIRERSPFGDVMGLGVAEPGSGERTAAVGREVSNAVFVAPVAGDKIV